YYTIACGFACPIKSLRLFGETSLFLPDSLRATIGCFLHIRTRFQAPSACCVSLSLFPVFFHILAPTDVSFVSVSSDALYYRHSSCQHPVFFGDKRFFLLLRQFLPHLLIKREESDCITEYFQHLFRSFIKSFDIFLYNNIYFLWVYLRYILLF